MSSWLGLVGEEIGRDGVLVTGGGFERSVGKFLGPSPSNLIGLGHDLT